MSATSRSTPWLIIWYPVQRRGGCAAPRLPESACRAQAARPTRRACLKISKPDYSRSGPPAAASAHRIATGLGHQRGRHQLQSAPGQRGADRRQDERDQEIARRAQHRVVRCTWQPGGVPAMMSAIVTVRCSGTKTSRSIRLKIRCHASPSHASRRGYRPRVGG